LSQIRNPDSAQRFFRAMVLMGGSLAAGCGGATSHDPAATAGAANGGAANGGAGSGGSGTGGGSGGGIVVGTGGAPIEPGPFDCPPAQWDCTAQPADCSYQGFALPKNCQCDLKRPLDATACASGQSFVCRDGTRDADGRVFTHDVPFECSCVSTQMRCELTCDQAFQNTGTCTQPSANEVLCGCAVVFLR
jgi:hypothetical protein